MIGLAHTKRECWVPADFGQFRVVAAEFRRSRVDGLGELTRDLAAPVGTDAQAMASFERARAIQERVVRENPSVTGYQKLLAIIYNSIGSLLDKTGRSAEAVASYEQARAIQERLAHENPESSDFPNSMGASLNNMALIDLQHRRFDKAREKLTQAVNFQQKALAANPDSPLYRRFLTASLKNLLRAQEGLGHADEAEEARRELAKLQDSDPRIVALDARLAAVLKGKETPHDDSERIQLAWHAYTKSLNTGSARLYAEALANDPKLGDDRQAQHCYNAACAASLAAFGQGKDDPPPNDAARAKLRNQARQSLQAELSLWAKVLDAGPAEIQAKVAPTLRHWKADTDLAGIRDQKEVAKLPDEERTALKPLWNDVDQLLNRAAASK